MKNRREKKDCEECISYQHWATPQGKQGDRGRHCPSQTGTVIAARACDPLVPYLQIQTATSPRQKSSCPLLLKSKGCPWPPSVTSFYRKMLSADWEYGLDGKNEQVTYFPVPTGFVKGLSLHTPLLAVPNHRPLKIASFGQPCP